jgi:hypothetical protein
MHADKILLDLREYPVSPIHPLKDSSTSQ